MNYLSQWALSMFNRKAVKVVGKIGGHTVERTGVVNSIVAESGCGRCYIVTLSSGESLFVRI